MGERGGGWKVVRVSNTVTIQLCLKGEGRNPTVTSYPISNSELYGMVAATIIPSFWFIQGVQVLAEDRDDAFILVGILPENVLDHNDSFLDNVGHFGLDQLHKCAHTALRRGFHLDGTAPNGSDRLAHKINIHFSCIPARN